jgi:hypothetical protein
MPRGSKQARHLKALRGKASAFDGEDAFQVAIDALEDKVVADSESATDSDEFVGDSTDDEEVEDEFNDPG